MAGREEDGVFQLKVEKIVHEVLNTRNLTVEESNKIRQAISDSLDLLLERKLSECRAVSRNERDRLQQEIYAEVRDMINESFSKHNSARSEDIKKECDKVLRRLYLLMGIVVAILTIVGGILKFAL